MCAHFRVIRHRRPKLDYARCDRIAQAAAPSRPIYRGIPRPALRAHIAVSKFAYHLPLHRKAVMYASDTVGIDPGAMGYWMGSIEALLAPLVDTVRRSALAGGKVDADDTPLPVLAPGNGRTKRARLWDTCVMTGRVPPKSRRWSGSLLEQVGLQLPCSLASIRGDRSSDLFVDTVKRGVDRFRDFDVVPGRAREEQAEKCVDVHVGAVASDVLAIVRLDLGRIAHRRLP